MYTKSLPLLLCSLLVVTIVLALGCDEDESEKDTDVLQEIKTPRTLEHAGGVSSVSFSPDSRLLASTGLAAIKLWDVNTGSDVGDVLI